MLLWGLSARSFPAEPDDKLFPDTQSLLVYVRHKENSFDIRVEQSSQPFHAHQESAILHNLDAILSLHSLDPNVVSRFLPLGLLQVPSPGSKHATVLNMLGIFLQPDSSIGVQFRLAQISHTLWTASPSLKRVGTLCHANSDRQRNYFKLLR